MLPFFPTLCLILIHWICPGVKFYLGLFMFSLDVHLQACLKCCLVFHCWICCSLAYTFILLVLFCILYGDYVVAWCRQCISLNIISGSNVKMLIKSSIKGFIMQPLKKN